MSPELPPLLSICVPTYNRAELLDVCLACLLPQVAAWSTRVEVVVCDNASSDSTPEVVAKYAQRFPLRCQRNAENIGLLGNITLVAGTLARGEFVWLLGDDDLLAAGAVDQVVELLSQNPDIDLVALNVGYYPVELRPAPADVAGGVRAEPVAQLRHRGWHGRVPFEQLLEGPCADFTAMYAAVLRRSWWVAEFPKPIDGEVFQSVRTAYPQAYLIAQHPPSKLAGALRDPLVCIYAMPAEQYSWAKYHALTVVLHATSLLKRFESHGISPQVLAPYYLYQLDHRGPDLGDLLWNRRTAGGWREALQYAWMLRRYPLRLLKVFVVACANPRSPWPLRWPVQWYLSRRGASRDH